MIVRVLMALGLMTSAAPSSPPAFTDADYSRYSVATFLALPALQQPVDLQHPDYALLNATIFYLTNQERARRNLPLLRFQPQLRDCANHHAKAMATHDFVSHENAYEPRFRTLEKRSKAYGHEAHAENVASTFLHAYRSGSTYNTRHTDRGIVFIDNRRQPIKVYTYLEFARDVVSDWMGSPGHRHNILFPELKYLGCAVQLPAGAASSEDLPLAYCVQNFSY